MPFDNWRCQIEAFAIMSERLAVKIAVKGARDLLCGDPLVAAKRALSGGICSCVRVSQPRWLTRQTPSPERS